MSVSFHTHLMLGFYLTDDQLINCQRHRGCAHAEVPGAKFCAQCGKPMWVENADPLSDLDSRRFTIEQVNTHDFQYETTSGAVAGLIVGVDNQTGRFELPAEKEWAGIEVDLRSVLASHGITPTGEFGSFFVRYVAG